MACGEQEGVLPVPMLLPQRTRIPAITPDGASVGESESSRQVSPAPGAQRAKTGCVEGPRSNSFASLS